MHKFLAGNLVQDDTGYHLTYAEEYLHREGWASQPNASPTIRILPLFYDVPIFWRFDTGRMAAGYRREKLEAGF